MKIHKEGYSILATTFIIVASIILSAYIFLGWEQTTKIITVFGVLFFAFITRFFRTPKRVSVIDKDLVIAPCDGKVVIVQEVLENEYLKTKCIQVSVFMSVFNVHVNYYPIGGKILYFKHHHGNYIIASHPKASEKNERTSIVIETAGNHKILFRQIAGYIARRIVCYAIVGERANQCSQVGFIKFGSRMDVFLPLDTNIMVKVGDKVTACETIIAKVH
ncbi:MAG: phosphatidylserine decarboxylase family protein [Bacteroidales bacterium]